MIDNIVKKGLALAIIILFICVSFQPVFAKDTVSYVKKSDTKELLKTIKNIVNDQVIQDIIQKSEIKGSPIRFQQLLGRLLKEIIITIEKNDEFNERLKQLSDLPCDCEKNNITRLWHFPVICILLFPLFILAFGYAIRFNHYYPLIIIGTIGWKLNCFWAILPP
jgi:hypothetical protein